mmetsp:Transcript_8203/g.20651  ORF Transcript_8203/g.20651 Transcript_8203/m.20651 type:complete len:207 (-) Transcript_8203:2082-2702(-)
MKSAYCTVSSPAAAISQMARTWTSVSPKEPIPFNLALVTSKHFRNSSKVTLFVACGSMRARPSRIAGRQIHTTLRASMSKDFCKASVIAWGATARTNSKTLTWPSRMPVLSILAMHALASSCEISCVTAKDLSPCSNSGKDKKPSPLVSQDLKTPAKDWPDPKISRPTAEWYIDSTCGTLSLANARHMTVLSSVSGFWRTRPAIVS